MRAIPFSYFNILPFLCLCLALYFPGLQGPMLLDDFPQLEKLMDDASHEPLFLLREYIFSTSGPFGRPVSMLSFILDANLHGNQLWLWKLTNLFLHICTATALYKLAYLLLKNTTSSTTQKCSLALLVSAVWMLHPLHTSTVLYTVQRMTILSTLFTALSLILYIEGRDQTLSRKRSFGWLLASIGICFPLAVLSKENALLIPLYFGLLEWLRFPNSQLHATWHRLPIREKWFIFFSLLLLVTIGFKLTFAQIIGDGFASRPFTLIERLMTEFRVLAQYLWEILAPSWRNLGFYHDDIAISNSLINPISTLYSLIGIFGLIVFGFFYRKRNSIVSFGILLFFASHILESTIFPLELMFEHRNYLGSFGIILALAAIIADLVKTKRTLVLIASTLTVVLSTLLLQFTTTWGNSNKLNTQLYLSHPDSPSAIAIMADRFVEAGNPNMAFKILDRPERVGFKLHELVIRCQLTHQLDDTALNKLNNRLNEIILSYELTGLFELANKGLDKQCAFSDSYFIRTLELAVSHTPTGINKQKLLVYKAYFHKKSGELNKALLTLEEAYTQAPLTPMPLFLATEWLLDANDKFTANQYYQRALSASNATKAITKEYIAHFETRFTRQE